MAADLNVENLILYHTEDKNIEHRQELYLEEAKLIMTEICLCRMILM